MIIAEKRALMSPGPQHSLSTVTLPRIMPPASGEPSATTETDPEKNRPERFRSSTQGRGYNTMRRIPFFLSMKGCPSRCVYCDQREITGAEPPSPRDVIFTRSRGISSGEGQETPSPEPFEVCFFGGSFTCLPRPLLREYLQSFRKAPPGSLLRFSTHPRCLDDASLLEELETYPISAAELGAASLDARVLIASHRNHDGETVLSGIEKLRARNMPVGVQLMLGLPEQDLSSALEDLRRLAVLPDSRQLPLRLYPCLVLAGTELERRFHQGRYEPLSVEDAAIQGGRWFLLAKKLEFPVLRIGLQETVSLRNSVVAGPYHPALGELVRGSALALELAETTPRGPWVVPAAQRSLLTGHGGWGIRLLSRITGAEPVEVLRLLFWTGEEKNQRRSDSSKSMPGNKGNGPHGAKVDNEERKVP